MYINKIYRIQSMFHDLKSFVSQCNVNKYDVSRNVSHLTKCYPQT